MGLDHLVPDLFLYMVPVIIPYSFSETGADLSFVWPGAYAILRKKKHKIMNIKLSTKTS